MAVKNWRDLSNGDFEAMSKENVIVMVPIGSMEQHGPHLPVSCDSLIVEAVIAGIMGNEINSDCLILPTVWCSKSNEHKGWQGTIYLSQDTLTSLLLDIGKSVAESGFRKLVFINSHGGNSSIIRMVIRDIRQETGLIVFHIDLPGLFSSFSSASQKAGKYDIHAESKETSVLLSEYPSLMEGRAIPKGSTEFIASTFDGYRYVTLQGGPVGVAWVTSDVSDNGVIGDPSTANPQYGKEFLSYMTDILKKTVEEISTFEFRSR